MRIFITGTTGYIGGAVARVARAAGHEVFALAHSETSARQAQTLGYVPQAGSLTDLAALAGHAGAADAVIHAGFVAGPTGAAADRAATEAMVTALAGSGRPFLYTSGVWVLGATGAQTADEHTPLAPIPLIAWRAPLEHWLRAAAADGAHAVILRPGVVYGHGGGIPGRIAAGKLPLVGDGRQRWPVVHVDDLALLYLAAVERARPGQVLHGIGGVVRVEDLVAAEAVQAPPLRQSLADAGAALGDFAEALALDQDVRSVKTQAALAWRPRTAPMPAFLPAGVAP